jgi:hypothetical protein
LARSDRRSRLDLEARARPWQHGRLPVGAYGPVGPEPRRRRAVKSGRLQAIARGQGAAASLRSAPPGDRKRSPWGDCAPSAWRLATVTFWCASRPWGPRRAPKGHGCKRPALAARTVAGRAPRPRPTPHISLLQKNGLTPALPPVYNITSDRPPVRARRTQGDSPAAKIAQDTHGAQLPRRSLIQGREASSEAVPAVVEVRSGRDPACSIATPAGPFGSPIAAWGSKTASGLSQAIENANRYHGAKETENLPRVSNGFQKFPKVSTGPAPRRRYGPRITSSV